MSKQGYKPLSGEERKNLNQKSLKDLQKKNKSLSGKKITKPVRSDVDKEQEKLQSSIQNWTYENADFKWKLEEKRTLMQGVRKRKKEARQEVDVSSDQLRGLRQIQDGFSKDIKNVYSARLFRDPEKKQKQLQSEVGRLRGSLQGGDITLREERDINKRIESLKADLHQVEEYIKLGVGKKVDERNIHKKTAETHKSGLDDLYTIWKNIKLEQEAIEGSIKEINQEIEDRNKKILEAKTKKQQLQSDYRNQLDDYQKYMEDMNRVVSAIREKEHENNQARIQERQRNTVKQTADRNERVKKKVSTKTAAEAEKEEKIRVEREAKAASLDRRRKAAQQEYERMQQYYRKRDKAPVVETATPTEEPVEAVKVDPNSEAKTLCRQLIEMCENMRPSDSPNRRRKKKGRKRKMRLTHKVENFTKFDKVGVKIPVFATELDTTIESLRERLSSYDEVKTVEETTV